MLQKYRLKDLGVIITGKTPPTKDSFNYGGDIPFITPSDDLSVKYITKTKRKLTKRGLSVVKNCELPKNSVCVSCIGSDLGKVVITSTNCVTNQQFNSIIVDQTNFDVEYLYYSLTLLGKKLNYLSKTSTAIPIINKSTFSDLEILVPPLSEQKEIANILGSLDKKIALNDEINDNLKNQAQAVYYERFEKIDFKNRPFNWQLITLGDIAVISTKSLNPAKESDSLLEHYSIPAFDETGFPVFEKSSSIKSNKYLVDEFSLLVSKLNPTIKRIWRPYCLSNKAVCSTEFIVFKAKNKDLTDFLYSVIDSKSFFN